jgi:hypothetical protein
MATPSKARGVREGEGGGLVTDEIVEALARRRYEVARLTDKYPGNWLTWEKLAEQPEALTVAFREMFLNGARSDLEAVAPLIAGRALREFAAWYRLQHEQGYVVSAWAAQQADVRADRIEARS